MSTGLKRDEFLYGKKAGYLVNATLLRDSSLPTDKALRFIGLGAIMLLCLLSVAINVGCTRDPHKRAIQQFNSAKQHIKDNKPDVAMIELRKAIQLDPGFSGAHYEMGKLDLAKGNLGLAFREFNQIGRAHV